MITFDEGFRELAVAPPRIGKSHVLYCLDLYQRRAREDARGSARDLSTAIESQLRTTALVPVISDFLFVDAPTIIQQLSRLNAVHDVFLIVVDVGFAYGLPVRSAGWVETVDVETGRVEVLSRRDFNRLAARMAD